MIFLKNLKQKCKLIGKKKLYPVFRRAISTILSFLFLPFSPYVFLIPTFNGLEESVSGNETSSEMNMHTCASSADCFQETLKIYRLVMPDLVLYLNFIPQHMLNNVTVICKTDVA